jgi:hypothetical protein
MNLVNGNRPVEPILPATNVVAGYVSLMAQGVTKARQNGPSFEPS